MGFVGDIAGKVGNMFGFGGGMNQYNAATPTNSFQAQTQPGVDYGSAVQRALEQQGGIQGQQQNLATQLQAQAAGKGPSLAQPLLQQATDANQNMAAGQIASLRGMSPGLAARQILQQRAGIQQNSAGQAAVLRSQEQLGAQGMLGQTLGTMGQQNLGTMGTAGHLSQNDWWNAQKLNQLTGSQNASMQLGAEQIQAGVAKQNADISAGAWGGLLGGLGGGAMKMAGGGGGGAAGGGGADMLTQGGDAFAAAGIAHGGAIPGPAHVAGDSTKNDTVPAMLSPGEIVIPRSVAQSPNAPEQAAAFVAAIHKHHRVKMAEGGEVPHYGRDVLAKQRDLEKRIKQLESRAA